MTTKPQVGMGFHIPCHSCHHFSVTTSREITFRRESNHACHKNGSEVVTETCTVIAGKRGCQYPVTKSGDRNCDNETPGKHPFPYPLSQLSPLFCDNFYGKSRFDVSVIDGRSRCHRNAPKAVTEACDVIAGKSICRHPVTKSGDRSCDNETAGKHPFPYPLSQLSPLFCDNFYENHVSVPTWHVESVFHGNFL